MFFPAYDTEHRGKLFVVVKKREKSEHNGEDDRGCEKYQRFCSPLLVRLKD